MTSPHRDPEAIVTVAELADCGLTPHDVRRRCPWAIEYAALDGTPCWRRDDLAELFRKPREGQSA
jgi:hypothetical protein